MNQKINWKSVEKDGLPEKSGEYLTCQMKSLGKSIRLLHFSARYRKWNCYDSDPSNEIEKYAIHGVTHWAEFNLPET